VVFLPAFEQGIIPTTASSTHPRHSHAIEEERRLAFVALTRARHIVYISHCRVRKNQWGPEQEMAPSQFIKEMGL
jgi:DNA helicase-2/ATP-dependent DNA helicase PcrA